MFPGCYVSLGGGWERQGEDVHLDSTMSLRYYPCSNTLDRKHCRSRPDSKSPLDLARSSGGRRRWKHTERCRHHTTKGSLNLVRIVSGWVGILGLDGPSGRVLG